MCVSFGLFSPQLLQSQWAATPMWSLIILQRYVNQVRRQYIYFLKGQHLLCFWGWPALSAWPGVINRALLSDTVYAAVLFTRKRNPDLVAKGVPRVSVHIITQWLKAQCVLFGGHVVSIQKHMHVLTHTWLRSWKWNWFWLAPIHHWSDWCFVFALSLWYCHSDVSFIVAVRYALIH